MLKLALLAVVLTSLPGLAPGGEARLYMKPPAEGFVTSPTQPIEVVVYGETFDFIQALAIGLQYDPQMLQVESTSFEGTIFQDWKDMLLSDINIEHTVGTGVSVQYACLPCSLEQDPTLGPVGGKDLPLMKVKFRAAPTAMDGTTRLEFVDTLMRGEVTIRSAIIKYPFESLDTEKVPCNVTVRSGPTPNRILFSVIPAGAGTIQVEGEDYGDRDSVIVDDGVYVFKARARECWSFAGWLAAAAGTDASVTLRVESDATIGASFVRDLPCLLEKVTVEPPGAGTVEAAILPDDRVRLTATPGPDHSFQGWAGAGTGSDPAIEVAAEDLLVVGATASFLFTPGTRFQRGETNDDGTVNLSDPVFLLDHLFRAGPPPSCLAAADANDDEILDLSDAVHVLEYLFMAGPRPPAPFEDCGLDPTPGDLGCADFPGCR